MMGLGVGFGVNAALGSGTLAGDCTADPVLISSISVSGFAAHVEVLDTNAYITTLEGALEIVDVSDPEFPALLGAYHMPGADGFALTGFVDALGIAYMGMTSASMSLAILDVSIPTNISLLGTYNTPSGSVFGVVVEGEIAYLADGSSGLLIVDVHDPAAPVLIGNDLTSSAANAVAVVGTLAYVAQDDAGLRILDVSDPTSPILLGTLDTTNAAINVAVAGSVAYVTDGPGGLVLIDVSDPSTPALLGIYPTASIARSVAIEETPEGTVAYVGIDGGVVLMVNVSNPGLPTLIGDFNAPASLNNGFAAIDGMVYAPGLDELMIVDSRLDCASPCRADMNKDGTLNFFDVSAFLIALGAGNASADLTDDGALNFFDVSAFLSIFESGCL